MKDRWEIKEFVECLIKVPRQKQVKSREYLDEGKFPIISQESELISGFSNDESLLYKHDKPVVIFGDHTKNVKFIDFDFVVGADGVHILYVNNDILPKFFYYELCSIKLRDLGYARHYKLLKEEYIKYPSLPEQQRIVDFLDAEFAKIDALKTNAEHQLQAAKDLFQAALTDIFTPKVGWEMKTLGDVGDFMRGGNFKKSDFVEDGIPCVHYGQIHMHFGVSTESPLSYLPKDFPKVKYARMGDLLIAITSEDDEGSCKCTAWMGKEDVAIGGHSAIYRHELDPVFMSYYFRTPFFQKEKLNYTHGFKVVEIKPSDIGKIHISYPKDKQEQQQIVARLDAISERVKALQSNYDKTITLCNDLKQALLKSIFE